MDAIPELLRQEMVMSGSHIDGQSVTTHRFSSAGSPEQLGTAMARHFQAAGRHVIELTRGEWKIVSARDGQGTDTIQLRATSRGTEGLATRWGPPPAQVPGMPSSEAPGRALTTDIVSWLPDKARVIRQMTHDDPHRRAGTVVAIVREDPGSAARHLRRHAELAGFTLDPALAMPAQGAAWYRGGAHASGEAMALRRQAQEVIATVSRQQETSALVIHWSQPK